MIKVDINNIFGKGHIVSLAASSHIFSGQGVTDLYNAINDMIMRGAPTEYDDQGFNKLHFRPMTQIVGQFTEGPDGHKQISEEIAIKAMNMLSTYQNTQFTEFRTVAQQLREDLNTSKGVTGGDEDIRYTGKKEFGKHVFEVPPEILDKKFTTEVNKLLRVFCDEKGAKKEVNQLSGKLDYPLYKIYSKSKETMGAIAVHPSVFKIVFGLLADKGYKLPKGMNLRGDQVVSPATEKTDAPKGPKVVVIEEVKQGGADKLSIRIPYGDHTIPMNTALKSAKLWGNAYQYFHDTKKVLVDKRFVKPVVEVMKGVSKTLDVSDLEKYIVEDEEGAKEVDSSKKQFNSVIIDDEEPIIIEGEAYPIRQIGITTYDRQDREEVNEGIKFIFPQWKYNRYINKERGWQYELYGDANQYSVLINYLNKFGFDTSELEAQVSKLRASDIIEDVKIEGAFEEHGSPEEFKETIEEANPNMEIVLRDKQKDGVAFLYSRNSALLGDETGGGKTFQSVVAANMKASNGKILIIVLNKTIMEQWVKSILQVIGEDNIGEISTDLLSPARWTIGYYSSFSAPKNREHYKRSIMDNNFELAIFDEIHMIKHSKSKRAQIISEISETIPVKWGLTATPVSNKPFDVKNQLKILGHSLGNVSDGVFKKEFAGMEAGGYRGSLQEGNSLGKLQAAQKLNKWLMLTGVMLKRTKAEMREGMPMAIEEKIPVHTDGVKVDRDFRKLIGNYKNPQLPVSQMLARRVALAINKVPYTSEKVESLVEAGEKALVFSCFQESQQKLFETISKFVDKIDSDFIVMKYTADEGKEALQANVQRFKTDPNAKVLVMSMKMGGTGVDFPNVCKNMVVNDYDWTPESKKQSEGRLLRINSEDDVNISYIVDEGYTVGRPSVDEATGEYTTEQFPFDKWLLKKLERKVEIAEIIQKHSKEYQMNPSDALEQEINKLLRELQKEEDEVNQFIAGLGQNGGKTASNSKKVIKISRSKWKEIGKKAKWL
jgi:superfamily II DNA or RNA helicase